LQRVPTNKQQDDQSSGDPKPPTTIRQPSPFIQQQRLPAYSK